MSKGRDRRSTRYRSRNKDEEEEEETAEEAEEEAHEAEEEDFFLFLLFHIFTLGDIGNNRFSLSPSQQIQWWRCVTYTKQYKIKWWSNEM